MKMKLQLIIALLIAVNQITAQNVGINTTGATPNSKAMLDIDAAGMSPKGGLLLPRLTTTERNSITTPIPQSLLIFNSTTLCFEAWSQSSASWVAFGCIGCQLPGAFSASAASGITPTAFSANWSASAGATSYFLDVATDAAFTTFLSGYNNLNVGNVLTTSVTGLTCATTYYYRVRANNACGTSINSNTISFATPSECIVGWPYKKTITINNTTNSNLHTNYQVSVIINHAALVAAGKSTATGSDLRFTDANCNILNYWIERGENTSTCQIWVKVSSIVANANTSIMMYYGNMTAPAYANGNATFILFDDFNSAGLDLTKWSRSVGANAGNTGVSSGYLHVLQDVTDASITVSSVSTSLPYQVRSISSKRVHSQLNGSHYYYGSSGLGSATFNVRTSYNKNYYNDGGCNYQNRDSFHPECTVGQKINTFWDNIWFREEMHYDGSAATNNFYLSRFDGTTFQDLTTYNHGTYSTNNFGLWFNSYGWWTGHFMDVNYIAIGKYISNEPTLSVGTEVSSCP